jgi:hypothetical protein
MKAVSWLKLVIPIPWLIALVQLLFFHELFIRNNHATSGSAGVLIVLMGAGGIAASLVGAAIITWVRRPLPLLFAVSIMAVGIYPYWYGYSYVLPQQRAFERYYEEDPKERARFLAMDVPYTRALDRGAIAEAIAVLDAHPVEAETYADGLFAHAMCRPLDGAMFELLDRLSPVIHDDGHWLRSAVDCHSNDAVRFVLEHGASLEPATQMLHQSRDPSFIAMLIEHGAPVDARDGDDTPLMRIRSNHITRVLLKHGADPNAHTKWGSTALHEATRQCYEDPPANCFEELLQAGADPMPPSEPGFSPRDYSARNEPDHRPHPALVAAEHAWRCAMLVPDDGPALPGCTTPPVSQKLLLERLLDPALFEADLATAQALLAPLGPFYKLTPLPTVRQLRRITEDYIFLVGFEPAQQPELSHPWLVRLRLYVTEDELRAAIKPFTLGELGTDEEHHVPIFRLPGARSIVVYDDSEPGVVVDLHRAQEPDMREKARRAR